MEAWVDFNLDQVNSIFGTLLDQEFSLPEYPPVLPMQLTIRNERSFESVVLGYNCIIVNSALKAACEHLKLKQVAWVSGSYVDPSSVRNFPDWAGICNESTRKSILPGDSKFTADKFNWSATVHNYELADGTTSDGPVTGETSSITEKSLMQVNHYAKIHKSRYCYLISPKEALFVRRRKDEDIPASESLANNRPSRLNPIAMPSQSQRSDSEPKSSSPATSDYSFTDNSAPDTNMQYLELCAVPWGIPVAGEISLNLALWATHMISAVENDVKSSYPIMSDDPALRIFSA
ncbi:hypothetical protein OCU04_007314 [Sclerotinia nivalis]|uniref:Uncharacterized protein n=1 Tax=Sclerotinia nivalis TaxID=352851 RepID=A0A9X0DIP7_9HELO|nr:hypothetical protein OCU04_007314 [Sclerotinia nivalis]